MTQLCQIRGCRIRNRHKPDCAGDPCQGCLPRVADEGLACDACTDRAGMRLGSIAELTPDARLVAAGLVNRGTGHGSGKPGSRSPLNDGATDALDAVTNALTTMARDIAETRGLHVPARTVLDPLVTAAEWLGGQLMWIRHAVDAQGQPYAAGAYAEIWDCLSRLRGILDGPAEQRFLGPCGTRIEVDVTEVREDGGEGIRTYPTQTCEGDVYGRPGAQHGTCRTCGHKVDQGERRAWLDDQTADLAAPARDIAYALDLSVKTIRSWATEVRTETGHVVRRAKLRTYYRLGEHVVPWTERPDGVSEQAWKTETEKRGPRLHYVGDVRILAQQAADRRAAAEQRRDREGVAA